MERNPDTVTSFFRRIPLCAYAYVCVCVCVSINESERSRSAIAVFFYLVSFVSEHARGTLSMYI